MHLAATVLPKIMDEFGWHEPRLEEFREAKDAGTSPPFSGVRLPSDRGVFPPTAVVFIPSPRSWATLVAPPAQVRRLRYAAHAPTDDPSCDRVTA